MTKADYGSDLGRIYGVADLGRIYRVGCMGFTPIQSESLESESRVSGDAKKNNPGLRLRLQCRVVGVVWMVFAPRRRDYGRRERTLPVTDTAKEWLCPAPTELMPFPWSARTRKGK